MSDMTSPLGSVSVPADAADRLRAVVAEIGAVDTTTPSDAAIENALVEVLAIQHQLAVATARLAHAWSQRGAWAHDGSLSPAARLCTATGASKGSCHRLLHDAAALDAMPAVTQAIVDRTIHGDLAPLFASARSRGRDQLFARDEQMLVDSCAGLRSREQVQVIHYWITRADAELVGASDGPEVSIDDASCGQVHASTTFDGAVVIDATLDTVAGEIVTNELDRLIAELRATHPERTALTRSQWRALALVDMATRSASTPADANRPRPLVTVLVGDQTLAALCETANGHVISPRHLHPYLGDALVESIIFDGPSRLVSVSQRRGFTGALRRGIQARDRRCQHPAGCDTPAPRCDVDHIKPACDGGPTSQWNGRLECVPHNRLHAYHDHHTKPPPSGADPTPLDEIRARLRWHCEHEINEAATLR
jgi:hypothetical protein